MYAKEKYIYMYWSDMLERLIEIAKFLGTQNLSFRLSSDTLLQKVNGNFLKLIQSFAKLWPIYEKSYPKRIIFIKIMDMKEIMFITLIKTARMRHCKF